MRMKLSDLAEKLRMAIGDNTEDLPEDFIINSYNYTINDLPMVPKLEKLFSKHKQFNLDAQNHYKWSMSDATGFRRITDFPMFNFYTSTGGEPCKLCICHRSVRDFYEQNGLISLKQPGTPCEYTIETEDDNVWLVFDRPLDIPVILDYIAYGFPKPVSSMDDEIEISAIAENLIIDVMKACYLREAMDYAFAADITSYLDNKKIIEAIQMLHRQWGMESPRVLGEV
jgi:hypothetical protein